MLTKKKGSKNISDSEEKKNRLAFWGAIIAATIALTGTISAAVINGWFSSGKIGSSNAEIYRVRVTVINPQGTPTEEAEVRSSFGGEAKKVSAGWQVDIPAASKPKDGKLSIYAFKKDDFLNGKVDLTLDKELNPALIIKLTRDDSAKVRGQIVNGKNRAIIGARVFVVGFENDAVITGEGGNFELPAHAAVGQTLRLHAEGRGYQAVTQEHPAGDHPATLVLEK